MDQDSSRADWREWAEALLIASDFGLVFLLGMLVLFSAAHFGGTS